MHLGPDVAWKGNYFYTNLLTTICYFVVDLLWVARVPISVKSPGTIIKVRDNRKILNSHKFLRLASLCGHCLSQRTCTLAGIPMVLGSLLISGNQYMVFDTATSTFQKKSQSAVAADCVGGLLHELDCYSRHSIPRHHVPLLLHGPGAHPGDWHPIPLADGIYAVAFLSVCFESQMDL